MEQYRHQGFAKNQQGNCAGQRQQHHDAQTPIQQIRILLRITAGAGGAELRHQHHAERHAQHRRRKLHQTVGIAEPTHAARAQMRGNLCVDEQRHLGHADAEQSWRHQANDAAGPGIGPTTAQLRPAPGQARHHTDCAQGWELHRQLQHAPGHHTQRHRKNRLYAQPRQARGHQVHGRDGANIEQDRRGGRHRKAPVGVEHARGQGHQGHKTDVGKHEARHPHRRVVAARVLLQAAGHGPHQERCRQHAQDTHEQQHPEQNAGHPVNQVTRSHMAVPGMGGSQHRDESLAERALSKHAAKQIGDAEGHIEGIRHGACTESGSEQGFAQQTGHAGEQRPQRDGRSGAEQVHAPSLAAAHAAACTAKGILVGFAGNIHRL